MPTVSVILPTYNRVTMLPEAIESVLDQTYHDWELIVIDDGSTDQTPAYLHRVGRAHRCITLIRVKHGGVSGARNAGLRVANGRYLAFLDDDDRWMPTKLATQAAYLESHPEVALVYAQAHVVDGGGRVTGRKPSGAAGPTFDELVDGNCIPLLTVVVRRQCLEVVGGFDPALYISQDYDLWLRVARQFPIAYLPEPMAVYRVHGANMSRQTRARYADHLKIYEKCLTQETNPDRAGRLRSRLASTHYLLARMEFSSNHMERARRHLVQARRLNAGVLWLLSWIGQGAQPFVKARWELREPHLFSPSGGDGS